MIRALAILVFASLGLFACDGDTPELDGVTAATPIVQAQHAGALAIAHGSALAVAPWMSHEEVEGSSALAVTGVRVDDPSIVEVRMTSHAYSVDDSESPNGDTWVLVGVTLGSTTLHLLRDDDEVGTYTVDVVEQFE